MSFPLAKRNPDGSHIDWMSNQMAEIEGVYDIKIDWLRSRRRLLIRQKTWLTLKLEQIPLSEMEDSHLINILRLVKRHCEGQRQSLIASYVFGPRPSGNGAHHHFDMELLDIERRNWRKFINRTFLGAKCLKILEKEVKRRRLEDWDDPLSLWC